MFYLKVGWRNIIKNFRRSLITMVSIIIGMTACLIIQGFFNWNINQLTESVIRNGTGHYQLYAVGFSRFGNDDPYKYLIQDVNPILKELQGIAEIETVTARVTFNGILASGDRSTVILGQAGDPGKERQLNSYAGLISGTGLSSEKATGIIIGAGVAKKLAAKVGDTLTLMSNMKDGGLNAVDLEVTGIRRQGSSDLDNMSVTASLGTIQNLLNTEGSVQKIVVLLKNTQDAPKAIPKILTIAKKYHLESQGWTSLVEFYPSVKLMYDVVFYVIILIVLAIVSFTISNTVNMNLNDRIREIGTIRALGTRRSQVVLIFISESGLMGFSGGTIGLLVSYLFIGFNELIGGIPVLLNLAEKPSLVHIFFHPSWSVTIICLVLFSLVAMVAAIIPAHRGARIVITEALRWV